MDKMCRKDIKLFGTGDEGGLGLPYNYYVYKHDDDNLVLA